jgi:hypothetical protein
MHQLHNLRPARADRTSSPAALQSLGNCKLCATWSVRTEKRFLEDGRSPFPFRDGGDPDFGVTNLLNIY